MGELWPVVLIHAWFWLVATITIAIQKNPVLTIVVILAAIGIYYAGYCTGWADHKRAELHED